MENKTVRKYLSISEVQKEYLPAGRKKIRSFVKKYLPVKTIGGRLFVEREALEALLTDPDRSELPL